MLSIKMVLNGNHDGFITTFTTQQERKPFISMSFI